MKNAIHSRHFNRNQKAGRSAIPTGQMLDLFTLTLCRLSAANDSAVSFYGAQYHLRSFSSADVPGRDACPFSWHSHRFTLPFLAW